MVQITLWALPVLSLLGAAQAASSVQDLVSKNFDDQVFGGTPSLVEFFAPWCGHCKRLAPVYEELADSFANNKGVRIAKVDGDDQKDLSIKYGISGFPTLKWFDGKSEEPTDYTGGRDLESLQKFITEKTGFAPKKKMEMPSEVVMLRDDDFTGAIGKDKNVFVAFTAPWCGHCKTLAPTWESLATSMSPEEDVVIAKVDADANTKTRDAWGITSFPTIKFFPKGSSTPVDYTGGRDEESFLQYLNEKAGTHRLPGGGLDAKAGTIAALNSMVESISGSDLAEVKAQVEKAAKGIQDTYAEYYVKVLDKLAANKGYLEKEMSRLQGLLAKGGLARPKEDDLTRRLNILKQFVYGEKRAAEVKEEL